MNSKTKPYKLDQLKRRIVFIASISYLSLATTALLLFTLPEWAVILIIGGFAVVTRALIVDITYYSSWVKPSSRSESSEHDSSEGSEKKK
ncbi:hypothetical protein N2599_11390 [Rhizobium sullae]|uniref:Uncharacterized protein n=1 Tax=Rhizobium sullae TaxID=50338 RepID=A0ABY5XE07_RHISU|nr:hypothetical protein [Rhizobium sullae]UWU12779.1 hypothetical protein N2599_11390 [Rhizobium sullae]